MMFWLSIALGLEVLFRVILEIREARLFSRSDKFAIARVIPFLNDFVPLPERRFEYEKNNPFVAFHEEAHHKRHHQTNRLLLKFVFFSVSILGLIYALDRWHASLIEIVILFHLALFVLQMPYHYYIWQQEFEADAYATKKTSITQAKKQLRELVDKEKPYSLFFALLYREHPPANLRLKKAISSRS